jgi:hypothetical protein
MSLDEKKHFATMMYGTGSYKEGAETKTLLAKLFAVSKRTMDDWMSRKDKELKERRSKNIADMWLACHTDKEISELVGCSETTVRDSEESAKNALLQKSRIFSEYEEPDFTRPLYDVWKLKEKTNSTSHFGNSEVTFTDNLLYMYTKPFDIVVDPFGRAKLSRRVHGEISSTQYRTTCENSKIFLRRKSPGIFLHGRLK